MSAPEPATLEVCVDTPDGLQAAQTDANRIELCSALALGGLSPSPGLLAAVRFSTVPVHAMIRPRAGGFQFSESDIIACLADIAAARQAGCAGVVIGASDGHGLDLPALRRMVAAAHGMSVTLHRVIDRVDDPLAAIEDAIALGIGRILTSGGAAKAVDGVKTLKAMQDRAADRIVVMAGSGVTEGTLPQIARTTGIRHFHASCSISETTEPADQRLGFAPARLNRTDARQIAALRRALHTL